MPREGGGFNFFFDILPYYFVNVTIKKLYIGSFIVYVLYFTHSLYCLFFPSPEKYTLGCKKCIFSLSFSPRWLKQTFYREFNYLHSKCLRFFILNQFPVIKTRKKQLHKNLKFGEKKLNIFLRFIGSAW